MLVYWSCPSQKFNFGCSNSAFTSIGGNRYFHYLLLYIYFTIYSSFIPSICSFFFRIQFLQLLIFFSFIFLQHHKQECLGQHSVKVYFYFSINNFISGDYTELFSLTFFLKYICRYICNDICTCLFVCFNYSIHLLPYHVLQYSVLFKFYFRSLYLLISVNILNIYSILHSLFMSDMMLCYF